MLSFVLFLLFLFQIKIVKGQDQEKERTIVIEENPVVTIVIEENDVTIVIDTPVVVAFPDTCMMDLVGFIEGFPQSTGQIINNPLYEMVMDKENIVGDLIVVQDTSELEAQSVQVIHEIYVKLVATINLNYQMGYIHESKAEAKKKSKGLAFLQRIQRALEKGSGHERFMHPMLMAAMFNGHYDIARVLLTRYDVTANDVNRRNKFIRTSILSIACTDNRPDIIKLLLKIDGININVQDFDGQTALYTPSLRGYLGVVKLLLEGDINVNKCSDEGISPLFIAAEHNRPAVVKILLNVEGIEVNTQEPLQGFNPHLMACQQNNINVIKALLSAESIDVNRAVLSGSSKGITSLHIASGYFGSVRANVKIVKMLLKAKEIKANLQCDQGGTALYAACNAGNFKVVKALLKHKEIAVNQEVKNGNTPLITAVFGGYIKIVKELLKVNGILVNKGFMFGSHGFANALIWARNLDDTAMIKLLLKNGAKENDNEIG